MEAPWPSAVTGMLEDVPYQYTMVRSCHGCFGAPGARGSSKSAFNPLTYETCYVA